MSMCKSAGDPVSRAVSTGPPGLRGLADGQAAAAISKSNDLTCRQQRVRATIEQVLYSPVAPGRRCPHLAARLTNSQLVTADCGEPVRQSDEFRHIPIGSGAGPLRVETADRRMAPVVVVLAPRRDPIESPLEHAVHREHVGIDEEREAVV